MSAAELAYRWKITPSRVHQLVKEGVLSKVARGKFDLDECTWAYLEFLRAQVQGGHTRSDLDQAKLEKEQLEVRRRQIEVAKAEGELIGIDDHRVVVGKIADAFRAALLSVPGSWGPLVVGITSPAEGTEAMRTCSEELLRDMAGVADSLDLEGQASAELLPEDFPGYRALVAAGIETFVDLRALEDVRSIKGIGPKLAQRIVDHVESAA